MHTFLVSLVIWGEIRKGGRVDPAGLDSSILNPPPLHFARNVSDEEVTMKTSPVNSFAKLEQILDIPGLKL